MKKLLKPGADEDRAIARGIARDADAFEASDAQIARARRGRPRLAQPKQAVSIRLDADILAHFKAQGPGWQSRINAALRDAVNRGGKR